jgi:hypothetical protein
MKMKIVPFAFLLIALIILSGCLKKSQKNQPLVNQSALESEQNEQAENEPLQNEEAESASVDESADQAVGGGEKITETSKNEGDSDISQCGACEKMTDEMLRSSCKANLNCPELQ